MAGTAPTSTDCVAYYTMDDANDSVGSNNLSVNGATGGATGVLGTCYSLDGSNDYINIADDSVFDFSGSFSISVWVKTGGMAGTRAIVTKNYNSTTKIVPFHIEFDGGTTVKVGFYNNGWYQKSVTATDIEDDNWHHIAMTWDGTNVVGYYDGGATSAYTPGASPGNNDFAVTIGARGDGNWANPDDVWDGEIDEVGFFNVALTADNVTYLYNGGSPTSAQQYPFSGSPPATPTYNAVSFGVNF